MRRFNQSIDAAGLHAHSDKNKRSLTDGARNPEFFRPVQQSDVPALQKLLKKLRSGLNEYTPIEIELVEEAMEALDNGNLQARILQRYLRML